jgi:hypothetical protein
MQAKEVARRPTQGFSPFAPSRKEAVAVLYGLPPAVRLDVVGTTAVENIQGVMQPEVQVGGANFRWFSWFRWPPLVNLRIWLALIGCVDLSLPPT